jgi:glycosyltransferase involved in cell wall biosynthesis
MVTYPRVAVLTPVRNGGGFLREALASVQAQTYPNIVHFVLDNASDDCTRDILKEFRDARVPVVTWRNEEVLPITANWNKCVVLGSEGTDYFRVLCADDTIPSQGIEKMVALGEADPGIVIVAGLRETAHGIEEFGWDRGRNVFAGREAIRLCFLRGHGIAPPHVLYRTSAVSRREAFFDDEILSFDTDAVFFLLTQTGAKLGFIHEAVGFTRRHAESVTEILVHKRHSDYFDWHVLIRRYGEVVLSTEELEKYKKAFRRHYVFRLLAWRWLHGNKSAFNWHMKALGALKEEPRALEYIDALSDYAIRKMGMRAGWTQYPQG